MRSVMETHRVRVPLGPLPILPILKRQFSEDGVAEAFVKGRWRQDVSRTAISRVVWRATFVDEEVTMVDMHFNRKMTSKAAIEWGLENNLMPANEKEVYAFGVNQRTSNLQYRWSIGLGSSLREKGMLTAPAVGVYEGKRILWNVWARSGWLPDQGILFVACEKPN